MKITLDNIGRRFNRDWIFKNINYTFLPNTAYAILGPNGSGKSTLLQLIAGSLESSKGSINYWLAGKPLEPDSVYRHISLTAPYLELIEEFTLDEMIDFHFGFKSFLPGLDKQAVLELLNLKLAKNKPLRYFSSGMKQRAKLALAFCSDTPLLLLDEPTSNLDTSGVDWYLGLAERFATDRLCIVSSNQPHEYGFCTGHIRITDYKTV